MEVKSLKELSLQELNEKVLKLRKETFNIRMQQYTNSQPKTHLLRQMKKDVARIKTIINQRVKDESRG